MKSQERIIDEFALILIGILIIFGALIQFFGTKGFIKENLTLNYSFISFELDSTKRIWEIYKAENVETKKSLIKEKCLLVPIEIKRPETIEKIEIELYPKQNVEIYAIYNKKPEIILNEIRKITGLESIKICPKHEASILFQIYLLLIVFVFAISFFLFQQFHKLRNFIIAISAISLLILLILITLEAKRETKIILENIEIKAIFISKVFKEFTFEIPSTDFKRAILSFEVLPLINSENLKVYINENEIVNKKYFSKYLEVIDVSNFLVFGKNILRFEIEGVSRYKIQNIKLMITY